MTGHPRDARPGLAGRGLHLAGLSALAVAQPLYDLLGPQPTFFSAHAVAASGPLWLALALSLIVPVALWLPAALAALASARLGWALHVAVIGALLALLVLPPLERGLTLPLVAVLAAATLVGAAGALAYARLAVARSLASALAIAAIVCPAFFLLASASGRAAGATAAHPAARVGNPVPIVLVVLDELPLFSLMNAAREIDATRYPHFAALARDAIWYRNATTVADTTVRAIPALLNGRYPPTSAVEQTAQPSLLSLLADSHALHVAESITALCPPERCHAGAARTAGVRVLLADAGILYLHHLAPAAWRAYLPDIAGRWAFAAASDTATAATGAAARDRVAWFRRFVRDITDTPRPTLSFIHVLLPHVPYEYLPSGMRYVPGPVNFPLARLETLPAPDALMSDFEAPRAAMHRQRRHLLQLALVDTLLGELRDHLLAIGLYDRALVIVTADHGQSFQPGYSQRFVTQSNYQDVMWVPLFVKLPHQRVGRVDDSNVQIIDVVPTVADLLEVTVPWPLDGRSLLRADAAPPAEKVILTPTSLHDGAAARRLTFPPHLPPEPSGLRNQLSLFGSDTPPEALYLAGSRPDLVGVRPTTEQRDVPAPYTVRLTRPEALADVRRASGSIPSALYAELTPADDAPRPPPTIAVVVNGAIVVVTEAYVDANDRLVASALLPDESLVDGENVVELLQVEDAADGPRLRPIAPQG